jgi:S-phase kinase-associated protein 1
VEKTKIGVSSDELGDESMINLVSKEGEIYEVPRAAASLSQLVKDTLGNEEAEDDDDGVASGGNPDIPMPNVSADVLRKVIEYCKHYQEEEMRPIQTPLTSNKLEEMVQQWYAEFVKVDKNLLFDLVAAANFMDIKPLLNLTCLAVSILIKGKSATELQQMLKISNEYTVEEQA